MKFGLALPHYDFSLPSGAPLDWEAMRDIAVEAESMGFDSLWVSDHLTFDLSKYGGDASEHFGFEWSTTLGALASEVNSARLGSLVVCMPIHSTLQVARSAATLQCLTEGRFELGLGAGWYEPDFALAGISSERTGARLRRLADQTGEVVSLMKNALGIADGADRLNGDLNVGLPPVTIGGKGGPLLLKTVAQVADKWNVAWGITPDTLAKKISALNRICIENGRNPASVGVSVGLTTLVGKDDRDLARRFERFAASVPSRPPDLDVLRNERLAGTSREVTDRIGQFAELGVEEIICGFGPVPFSIASADDLRVFSDLVIRG